MEFGAESPRNTQYKTYNMLSLTEYTWEQQYNVRWDTT